MKKFLVLFLIVGSLGFWQILELNYKLGDSVLQPISSISYEPISTGFLINTKGCRIHNLDSLGASYKKYFFAPFLDCNKTKSIQLVAATATEIYVSKQHPLANSSGLKCCFRPFIKGTSVRIIRTKFFDTCEPFYEPKRVVHQFVEVECKNNGKMIHQNYFTFVQKVEGKQAQANSRMNLSVLMIGLDGMSRLNLYRQMPKTVKFLEETHAIELLGYNKVGSNTFPNLVPVLTGLSVAELKNECWLNASTTFDDCPFIWNNYKEKGYMTAYGEDSHNISLFYYQKKGFRESPVNYFLTPYFAQAENKIGHEHRLNTHICLGDNLTCKVLLGIAKNFAFILKGTLSFGFFWINSISHDFINLPKYSDNDHFEFLTDLKNNDILSRTITIFMSDHGIRWGPFRRTYNGYLEERLPFLFLLLPDWFQAEYPQAMHNLRKNQHRLTTPFDLYETLKDVLDLSQIKDDVLKFRYKKQNKIQNLPRGISLFTPVSEERTCKHADINPVWCTCHTSKPADVNDLSVKLAAAEIVNFINKLLEGYVQCAELALNEILKARYERVEVENIVSDDVGVVTDYTTSIQTTPGLALFEATVRLKNNTFSVLPPVNRINTYGTQSRCVSDYKIKLYCYC